MKNILTIAETEAEQDFILELIDDLHTMTAGIIQQLNYEKEVIEDDKSITKEDFKLYTKKNKELNSTIFRLFEMMHGIIDWPTYIILRDKIAERVDLENKIVNQEDGENVKITLNTTIQDKLQSFKHDFQLNDIKSTKEVQKRKRGRPRKNQ